MRQRPLTPADERFLIIRSMVVQCFPGVQTTSATPAWHRLVWAEAGVMIVRTPDGVWTTPTASAVWVPAGVRHELEMCGHTALRMLYVRTSIAKEMPKSCRVVEVSPLLRQVITRIAAVSALDRRVDWQAALARLVVFEVLQGASAPRELVWPDDPRAARIANLLQSAPGNRRSLQRLCKGQGVGPRTVQRLFPAQTGLTFEKWRSRLRLLHATRLLAEGRKVSDVADSCGYLSVSAFVAAFRQITGVTPGQFCRSERLHGREFPAS